MSVFRIELTKEEQLRYISHLDYYNLLQRAIRRAKLPAAYSEGFNPHMKVSFASALAVGVTASAEYADVELTKDICQPEFFDKLSAVLPEGMRLLRVKKIVAQQHHKSMNALADMAIYAIQLPENVHSDAVMTAVNAFNATSEVLFLREKTGKGNKKGQVIKKIINIKEFVATDLQYDTANNVIIVNIKVSSNGSIKPAEVIASLQQKYLPQLDSNNILINRNALLSAGKNFIDLL
ncbi:TIGR03936 family radical SAM-associated protein [Pectinatus frisingensis]|jgi:radical SAM-linked protein|uniref:TIGR03936 family radical SAM-associated protein n=1 Tax=Pectinatus frisingensis TaxID=865 RepID=UPI001E4780DD|nr:TIGR03936 family radical SAM-associated protein [Pectinatus frisingensis]